MLKIAVCDDNKYICSEIEMIIMDYATENHIQADIEIFYSGEGLVDFIRNRHSFDLIFLDIELGSATGIDIGSRIRNELDDHVSKIVFVTSHNGYEQQLFDLQPLNFIRKPIDPERLRNCLKLTVKLLDRENKTFTYKKGHEVIKVHLKDIIYLESKRKQIKIVTTYGEDYFYGTMAGIREKLPKIFIEPHGSFLINFHKIIRLGRESVSMEKGIEIPVSQRNLKGLRNMLLDLEREKNAGL